jgi:hypothetical protein
MFRSQLHIHQSFNNAVYAAGALGVSEGHLPTFIFMSLFVSYTDPKTESFGLPHTASPAGIRACNRFPVRLASLLLFGQPDFSIFVHCLRRGCFLVRLCLSLNASVCFRTIHGSAHRVAPSNLPANGIADHSVGRTMVSQFSDCQALLVRASRHPRTTADTLGLNEGFIHRNGDTHELGRAHVLRILPVHIQGCSISNCAIVTTICLER